MAFDYEGAKKAGYSDEEINAYLASKEQSKPQKPEKLSYQQGDNPLLYTAAKAQELTTPAAKVFGESDLLPAVGAIAGHTLGGVPGTGVGTAGGMALQGLFRPGDTPIKDIARKSTEAMAWDVALTKIIPSILFPSKTAMKARNFFITKNGQKMIDGTKAAEAVTKTYNKIPAAQRTPAVTKAYEATVKELNGRIIPLEKAVTEKMSYFKPVFSETTGAKLKGTPLNQILESAGHGLRSQIREASPGVATADDVFGALARAKQAMKWPVRIGAGAAMGAGVSNAIYRVLGR